MGLEIKVAGKQLYVPLGWVISSVIGFAVIVGGLFGPFIKPGLVMWAADEMGPVIEEKVLAQVEVTVDSLNIRQKELITEQQAQKVQMDSVTIWVKEMKEASKTESENKMTKEDFKALMLEALEEADEP